MRLNIFCDFDGTIANLDVTDKILGTFALPAWRDVEREWKAGRIGSRECMSRQVELLDCSIHDLDSLLGDIGIDPDFASFVSFCQDRDWSMCVLSDGIDYAIHSILHRDDLDSLPVYSNRMVHSKCNGEGGGGYRLEFPYANLSCSTGSGTCKCSLMRKLGRENSFNILIGDGASDFCAAAKVDLVLAKDKLLAYCRKTGLPCIGFANFEEATGMLSEFSSTSFFGLVHNL